MSHFITDDAISQLPENERLNKQDLFIVSEKQGGDEGKFKSRKVDYETLSSCLYEDMDMSEIVRKITVNRRDINVLSTDVGHLSADIGDLSTRFLSNDELTRTIPGLSDIIISILNESIYFQRIDKLVDLSTGYNGLIFRTMDSAVNFCHVGSQQTMNRAIFRVPDNLSSVDERLSSMSRHLILDVSSDYECSVKFSNNCSYVSTQDITEPLSSNSHTMFIMKEIAPNVMYVQRQNVVSVYSGTDAGELVVAVCYNEHQNGDDWEYGTRLYEAISGTYVSSHTEMSAIANDISVNVNVGEYFQYIVDMSKPTSRLTIGNYLALFLSSDMVLSAVYGNSPVFTLRFYGNKKNEDNTDYVIVQQFFPVAYGDNVYEENLNAVDIITAASSEYILSDQYLIKGWAKGALSGGICRWYQKDDWNIPESPEDFPNTDFYAITDKIDNEISVQIGPFGQDQQIDLKIDEKDQLSVIDETPLYGTYLFIDTDGEEDVGEDEDSSKYFLRLQEDGENFNDFLELSDLREVQLIKLDTTIYVPEDD